MNILHGSLPQLNIRIFIGTSTFFLDQKKGSVTQKITLSNGETIRAGVTKLERYKNGIPVFGSVADPRMGSNTLARCKTCDCSYAGSGSKMDDCPGHFGHIELCRPVYHCGFIDEVVRILRCVCFSCSRLLLDENSPKDRECLKVNDPETRFRRVHDRCKRETVRCESTNVDSLNTFLDAIDLNQPNGVSATQLVKTEAQEFMDVLGGNNVDGVNADDAAKKAASSNSKPPCGATMPKFRREGMTVYVTYPDDMETIPGTGQRKQVLSAQKVFEVLRRISDEDVVKIGFDPKWARPEWMLVTVLPVPPPHVRPTVMEGDIQSEDDLTFQLTNIVKANLVLEDAIVKGHPRMVIADLEALLQARITSFFDNERDDNPREVSSL